MMSKNLLSLKYEQNQDTSLEELRSINSNSLETNVSLDETGEFQESVLSVVSKTMTNENANEEFLPDVVGRLIIFPSKVDHYVVYGSSLEKLEFGPGYYISTALPGTGGNFAIAGHRTTYGAPFKNLDKLKPGDNIYFQTNTNQYTYTVSEVKIVDPQQYQNVLDVLFLGVVLQFLPNQYHTRLHWQFYSVYQASSDFQRNLLV